MPHKCVFFTVIDNRRRHGGRNKFLPRMHSLFIAIESLPFNIYHRETNERFSRSFEWARDRALKKLRNNDIPFINCSLLNLQNSLDEMTKSQASAGSEIFFVNESNLPVGMNIYAESMEIKNRRREEVNEQAKSGGEKLKSCYNQM